MRAIDVLCAICAAVDKGDEPELILAEDSPLMEDARELLKPQAPYEPTMLSRMDDLVDERNYLQKKVISLEESIERTFDDMAVLRHELSTLRESMRWIPVGERLPENDDERQGQYLVAVEGKWVKISYFCPQFDWDYADVTHWMPLPKPPEDSSDE